MLLSKIEADPKRCDFIKRLGLIAGAVFFASTVFAPSIVSADASEPQSIVVAQVSDWFSGGKEKPKKSAPKKKAAVAQTKKAGAKKGGTAGGAKKGGTPWAVSCGDRGGDKLVCEMTQQVIETKSRQQLLLISVKQVAGGKKASAMLFRVFHGVYIPAGMNVTIDKGKSKKIAYQKSDRFGVYAALPLTKDAIAKLRGGKKLNLGIEVQKGKPIKLAISLNGFGKAYDKIASLN